MAQQSVDDFITSLEHSRKAEIQTLRRIILAADPTIREEIKWNAPSFYTSEHFATMHLRTKQGIGLIMHFGAKKDAVSETGVTIADPNGLLQWLAKDRAVVAFSDTADIESKRAALTAIIREWIKHL